MHIVRIFPTAILVALGGYAIGVAGPALADDSLNGHYQAIAMAHALILWVAF